MLPDGTTPERWQQIKEILAHVLEQDPSERASYLDRACAGDSSLRAELDRWLAAEQNAGTGFLVDKGIKQRVELFSAVLTDPRIGHRVGPYKLVQPDDFNPLHGDPQFEVLLADLNKRTSDQPSPGK